MNHVNLVVYKDGDHLQGGSLASILFDVGELGVLLFAIRKELANDYLAGIEAMKDGNIRGSFTLMYEEDGLCIEVQEAISCSHNWIVDPERSADMDGMGHVVRCDSCGDVRTEVWGE